MSILKEQKSPQKGYQQHLKDGLLKTLYTVGRLIEGYKFYTG